MFPILEMTYDDLVACFAERYGKGPFLAAALYRDFFKRLNPDAWAGEAIARSPGLVQRLQRDWAVLPGHIVEEIVEDGVLKFITELQDGNRIESVIISMASHRTVCISSQVGCRMGCRFCETGKMGLVRNLSVAEITGQVYTARRKFDSIRNVVFMGMGEPLDNFDAVVKSLKILNDQRGFDIAQRHITVSTVGLTGGIQKLAASAVPGVNLSVSLNAADNRLRNRLMPINRDEPLDVLQRTLKTYPCRKGHGIMINYVLIPGANDTPGCADRLADWLLPIHSRVNLIPFNPGRSGEYRSPEETEIESFRKRLIHRGVNIQRRHPRGRKLMAACGQLGSGQ